MNSRRRGLQALDTLIYAVVMTAVLFVVSTVVSLLFGRGFVGTKHLLFFVGFAMFGYGAFSLQPVKPWKDDDGDTRRDTPKGLQRLAERAIPQTYRVSSRDRLSTGAKLFVASLFVLGTSAAMEFVFGVGSV
ncbi:hypothetical protein SAMN04487950_3689 [Halogranum rubrum]|uniref:Uncharacterized protein n=1 Tax=Halogranum rubrum TaxID=553466 RepID=A0A1I4HGG6_9EURY|nr:hypothetical protein [Halogranum rubrum]SFL40783.1 hypothetical protein SAMN04487950_3689 [Halogranum rubrum]